MNLSSGSWICALVAAAIFILDGFTPLGITVPMLYVIPILLTWFVPGRRVTVIIGSCSILLTMLGIVISPGEFAHAVAVDRALASMLEFFIALLVIRQKQSAGQVTEAQEARDASEERLWLALHGGDLGSWDVDVKTGRAVWNRRHAIMLGYELDSGPVSIHTWKDRIHRDDLPRVVAAIELAKTEHRLFAEEHRITQSDAAEERWLMLYGRFFYDEAGEPVRFSGVSLDITERKRAEEELRRHRSKLEDLTTRLLRAQEEERRRIARDLHDDITQRMAALAIDLQNLSRGAAESESTRVARVRQLGAFAEDLTKDLQQLAHRLHPSLLEHAGLEAAVYELVDEFEERTGLKTDVTVCDIPADLPLDQATCFYRVLQESLQNVRKHATATSVGVRLVQTGRGMELCVYDDGRGFKPSRNGAALKGLGLTSMEERVRALSGMFRVRTRPGDGTEIRAWVPLEPRNTSEVVKAGT